jgi:hypothetical protein
MCNTNTSVDTEEIVKLVLGSWKATEREVHAMTFGISPGKERCFLASSGLGLLIKEMGASEMVVLDFLNQFISFFSTLNEMDCVASLKYAYALPMSLILKNKLPPRPEKVWAWSGIFRRWLLERIAPRAYCRKNVWFCYSWLQCKRCTASVTEEVLLSNYEKHRKLLTTKFEDPTHIRVKGDFETSFLGLCPVPFDVGVGESESPMMGGDIVRKCLRPFLAIVREQLNERYYEEVSMRIGKTNPSISASFQGSRNAGGQMGKIMGGRAYNQSTGLLGSYVLVFTNFTFFHRVSIEDSVRYFYAVEEYDLDDWCYEDIRLQMELGLCVASCSAQIQGIREPLKVRTISKGNADPYFFSKPFQQCLHGLLKKFPAFRLLGRPCNVSDIDDVLRWSRSKGLSQNFSIDYSNATDGLDSALSMWILEELGCELPVADMDQYRKVLGPHQLEYPLVAGVKLDDAEQVRGQLMGSIISFPILCIANFGVYLAVKSIRDSESNFLAELDSESNGWEYSPDSLREQGGWEELQHGVLVNGDDMYYCGEESQWDIQNWISSSVGLEPSVGKAYIHSRYVNINSTCYDVDLQGSPVLISYLPVGLMNNIHKVQSGEVGLARPFRYSSVEKITEGCRSAKMACRVLAWLLHRYKLTFAEELKGRNLFVHESLGGGGLTAPFGWKYTLTKDQLHFADLLWKQNPNNDFLEFPSRMIQVREDPETVRDITSNDGVIQISAETDRGRNWQVVGLSNPKLVEALALVDDEDETVFDRIPRIPRAPRVPRHNSLLGFSWSVCKRVLRLGIGVAAHPRA